MFAIKDFINMNSESEVVRKRVKRYGKIGGGLAGGGGLVAILFPMLINAMLGWQLVLKEDNMLTNIWQDVPVPVHTYIYIWNLENPKEFQNGAKPRVREMGPYAYTTYLGHEIIRWGAKQESVHFYMKLRWEFNEEKSVGSLDDKITILNPNAYATAAMAKNLMARIPFSFTFAPVVYGFLNAFLYAHGEGFVRETTVKGFLEGEYLDIIGTAEILIKPLKWLDLDILRTAIVLFETRFANNKFGLLHMVNGTKIGPYEVWTGQTDSKMFDRFKTFWGDSVLSHWDDPYCNIINGTQGLWFGSYLNTEDKLYMFFGELGRPIYLTYKGTTFHRGIPAWTFRIPPAFFASPNKNPDNKCFCATPDDYAMCDGIFDLAKPYFGAPAAVSFPHLLYASDKIKSTVEGMSPDPDKHEAYFDINPAIGAPIGGSLRLQANLLIEPLPLMFGFGDLPRAIYPLIWLNLNVDVEGVLEWLLRIGMWSLLAIESAPYAALYSGLGVLGYTANIAYRERRVLFKRRDQSIPIEPNYAIDRQTQAKAQQLYPNLFTISQNGQQIPTNPPLYNESQQHSNSKERPKPARRSSPLSGNDVEQGQQRVSSPPGAVE